LAISYTGWTSQKQRTVGSKRRQLDKTEAFCQKHRLVLDQRSADEPKSAFKGENCKNGASMVRFLKDVKAGRIPKGTVLIMESLDWLSRETGAAAMMQFLEILQHGIDIVTLFDMQWYSQKSIATDFVQLIVSLTCLIRAQDEARIHNS